MLRTNKDTERETHEVVINLLEGGLVVVLEADSLPGMLGHVGALGGFLVQVGDAVVLENSGVEGVGERAAASVAQATDVVLVAAEGECACFGLVCAVVIRKDVPHRVIALAHLLCWVRKMGSSAPPELARSSAREVSPLIDSLPYADTTPSSGDDADLADAKHMTQQELRIPPATPHDRLPPTRAERVLSDLTHSELERIERGERLPGLDESRLSLERPHSLSSPSAWSSAIANAKAQLQHQTLRSVNLQLLDSYGEHAWRSHNARLEAELHRQRKRKRDADSALKQLHIDRRVSQEKIANELSSHNDSFLRIASKNAQIAKAINEHEEGNGLSNDCTSNPE